jgi:hypothetical protein
MNPPSLEPHIYHFCFPALDTLLQVEETGGEVTVRASRNSFSEVRKTHFIHELAAEGFIPEQFQWLYPTAASAVGGVRWLVDHSCFRPDGAQTVRTRRVMVRLLGAAGCFWLVLMGILLLRGGR